MAKAFISTSAAPAAIGIYSQAVAANGVLYISGQIPLVPETMALVSEDISEQIHQVFQYLPDRLGTFRQGQHLYGSFVNRTLSSSSRGGGQCLAQERADRDRCHRRSHLVTGYRTPLNAIITGIADERH